MAAFSALIEFVGRRPDRIINFIRKLNRAQDFIKGYACEQY
jgi:hypothetical protein